MSGDNSYLSFDPACTGHHKDPGLWDMGFVLPNAKFLLSISMTDISFPTLATVPALTEPKSLTSKTYCNSDTINHTYDQTVITVTETTGLEVCFHLDAQLDFGASATVEGSVPFLAKLEGSAHWDVTLGGGISNCMSSQKTKTVEETLPSQTLPPMHHTDMSIVQWQGHLADLPYQATLKKHYNDGSDETQQISGKYHGLDYTSTFQKFSGGPIDRCDNQMEVLV